MASADKVETTVVKTEVRLTLTLEEAEALYALTSGVACKSEIYDVFGALSEVLGADFLGGDPPMFSEVFEARDGEVYAIEEE